MSRRQRLIGSIVVVLTLLLGVSAVTGVAVGQTTSVDSVQSDMLADLPGQHNETDTEEATRHIETIRTTIEERVVTRNASVNVSAIVRNERMRTVTESLTLRIDGTPVTTRTVIVPPNATRNVVFPTVFTEIGVHNVSVGNSSTVVGVTKSPSALPERNQSAAGSPSQTATPGPSTAGGPGLFTVLVGAGAAFVVVVSAVAVLAVRRLR
ncbi:hypothetical protein [Halorientalis salina]|uniref:hypothetical protein n=1 Tax=Halorientalis salina TaxID=2932266 RepID=UPI0010AC2CD5|nr:hypothetical protein [Halorientalis salina]